MANSSLQATSPLKGFNQTYGETTLSEVTDLSIFSIALSLQPDAALDSIKLALGTTWPAPGKTSASSDASYRLLGLQSDQVFALVTNNGVLPELDQSAYITDQSDSWVCLRLAGPMSISALERICPIDLHSSVFTEKNVARTTMEHLAVIILCEATHQFLLLSPSSSALSMLHAVQTSLRNVHE